ncbi:hypothetical protein ACXIT0_08985 [Methylorubrum extorquens]|uniref:Chitin-binding type-3 domain-containing protein n=1 Tax=Methylorubrum extorquens TaxID=408 RepID=A0AAX3WI95_METEX|nr:hypothetical protein [Methylorubrum extorquens]KQO88545.1 hypothetical protein ASF33_23650 [Methylobacterium sp. Leaf92]WHQ69719.1 hypothetical protein KEC54_25925 [Methylorubrum extorquens]
MSHRLHIGAALIATSLSALIGGAAAENVLSTDSQGLVDLRTAPPPNIFISHRRGTFIDYCSFTGCLKDYPGILAQTYLAATTRVDNAQEVGLHVDFRSKTGYAPVWKPSTRYSNTEISKPGSPSHVMVEGGFSGRIYRNVGGDCTSAPSGPGPQGTNPNAEIRDGSCRWRYYADGLNGGKSGFSVATVAEPGAAQTWGIVTAFNAGAGIGDSKMFPHEWDCNNYNKDSFLGGTFFMNCFYFGGGGAGTHPQLSTLFIDNANKMKLAADPTRFGYHFGLFFAGSGSEGGSVIKDAVLFDSTKSNFTVHANAGQPHIAFLRDDSDSQAVLQATATHVHGIDFSLAAFTSGVAVTLPSNVGISFRKEGGATLGYSSTAGRLQYGGSPAAPLMAIDDGGYMALAGNLGAKNATFTSVRETAPSVPTSSRAPCEPGARAWDQSFEYRCVAKNTWKRSALSDW